MPMNKKHITIATVAAVLASVAGVYGSAAALGIFLDRPLWLSEGLILADSIQQLKADMDDWRLDSLQAELDRLELKVAKQKAAGQTPSDLDQLRIRQLRRQIESLKTGD